MGVLDVFNWTGLSVAPGNTKFDELPTWTRLDTLGRLRVHEVQIDRGRQSEFETHECGTIRARLHDRDGDADPTVLDWTSRPIAFAVRNPITDTWHPRYRGEIEDHSYALSPGMGKGDVELGGVDAIDYFANFELAPGLAGDTPPPKSAGFVFYEDTAVTGPQIRINQALADCGWPSELSSIFTGNVNLLEGTYSPGDSILAVMRDAADAELPGIGQLFVDRYGVVCFHGRRARFFPASTAATATHWDYHEWDVGGDGVQFRWPFVPTRTRRLVRNQAMAFPQDLKQELRGNQVVVDSTSVDLHGGRSWSAQNLLLKDGITSGLTGAEEAFTYAEYIVSNYADPPARIDQISFVAIRPEDVRAPELWDLLTQIDIADSITLTRAHPGGGGFVAEEYFVEGISELWRPFVGDLDTGYPFCEMTLNLSPASLWGSIPVDWGMS